MIVTRLELSGTLVSALFEAYGIVYHKSSITLEVNDINDANCSVIHAHLRTYEL